MPQYQFIAAGREGRGTSSVVTADSARDAREKLRAQGVFPESIVEVRRNIGVSRFPWLQRRGRNGALVASAVRDLATLMSTGIGLVDCLDTVAAQNRGRFGAALQALRERVAGGASLSEAMQEQPEYYDDLIVQMVRVGENAGTLDTVLDRVSDFKDRSLQFKDRITTALVYPAIIISLATVVSIFLMTVVLPMLLENLVASGRPLPWPTRVLKTMSDIATQQGWWIGGLAIIMLLIVVATARTGPGKRLWHRLVFSLPLLGPLAKKQEIARSAIVISTLMENGIVFVEAMRTASQAAKNILLKEALSAIQERVQSGGDIGEALTATKIFPPLVIQIFTVGQQTGELERMLNRLSSGYEAQVASATARLTAALEPILIVILAIVVGFILFATILPILEAGNVL